MNPKGIQTMNSDFLPKAEMAQAAWGDNFSTVAAANVVPLHFTPTELGPFDSALAAYKASITNVESLKGQLRAAMQTKKAAQSLFVAKARQMNLRVQGTAGVLDSLKSQLGLLVRAAPVKRPATTPQELMASGFETGVNSLKWKTGSGGPGATYCIEAQFGTASAWTIVGMTTAARFEHTGQTPGNRIAYRVRACKADQFSSYSNEAVVYADLPSVGLTLLKAA